MLFLLLPLVGVLMGVVKGEAISFEDVEGDRGGAEK